MEIKALLKGLYTFGGSTFEKDLPTAKDGTLLMQQLLPWGAEMARRGKLFSVISIAAAAGLVVRPSTVALVTVYNGEMPGGPSYVIDRMFAHNLVATAEWAGSIWAQINQRDAAPIGADDLSAEIRSHNGKNKYTGQAFVGVDETVVAEGWFPWGPTGHTVTVTTPGGHVEAEVAGRLIVPPQNALSIAVVGTNAGATFTAGASWYEAQLDLE